MKRDESGFGKFLVLSLTVALSALSLIFIFPASTASPLTPQGKGGTIKPVPTPTPATKKTTPKKPPPAVNPKVNPKAPAKVDDAAATERTYWESIRNSIDPEDFRAYLKKYPNGQFADLAQNRIRALEAAKAQPVSTPTPVPEPAYEWTKVERDLPASVRVEFVHKNLSFSIPSGWTRMEQKEGTHYLQINFRAPNSPQTNISIQCYYNGIPNTLRNGAAELWRDENAILNYRRKQYASQKVSAKLTDTEVVNHPTGRWQTFTADVLDVDALENWHGDVGGLAPSLDAVYDEAWQKQPPRKDLPDTYDAKPGSLSAFTRTRHSYAIRQAGDAFIVMLYTAPIDQFDEKMLPSVMATLKMSGGRITVNPSSSDTSVSIYKYEPEIMIDGERKGEALVSGGKHHVTVRAKEHKPVEKDVFIAGWEDLKVEVKLERITTSTSGAAPK